MPTKFYPKPSISWFEGERCPQNYHTRDGYDLVREGPLRGRIQRTGNGLLVGEPEQETLPRGHLQMAREREDPGYRFSKVQRDITLNGPDRKVENENV